MTYTPRITADPGYLQALGRALFNFTYLEWVVICTIAKLSHGEFGRVPKGATAAQIAKTLGKAIASPSPPLPHGLRLQLVKLEESYRAAMRVRNKLLHAHPYTGPAGAQQLVGGGIEWPFESVNDAAQTFEDVAIAGNRIYHEEMSHVRT